MRYQVFYRTSRQFGRHPIDGVDARLTFKSLLRSFSPEEIAIICDNSLPSQYDFFASRFPCTYRTQLGNCGSFRLAVRLAAIHPADIYYFVEDDHLHLPLQKEWLAAGLEHCDFVSLYDHPDKYFAPMYWELRRSVVVTSVGHFADVPSTVMTFACRSQTLSQAREVFLSDDYTGAFLRSPRDHEMFCKLRSMGYSISSSIPGRSTHCEKSLLSPLVNWRKYAFELSGD